MPAGCTDRPRSRDRSQDVPRQRGRHAPPPGNEANQAGWTQATYITPDTEAISARATEAFNNAVTDFAKRAATFNAQNATPEQQRKLTVLKNSLTMASPSDPKEAAELARLVTSMDGAYGRGKYCPQGEGSTERVSRYRSDHRDPRQGSQPCPPARSVGGLAHDLAADSRRTTSGSSKSPTRARRNSGSPIPV